MKTKEREGTKVKRSIKAIKTGKINLIIRVIIALFIITISVSSVKFVHAYSEKLVVEQTLNSYYKYFAEKNLNEYLSLKIINQSNLKEIKELTKEEWKSITILSYSLSNIDIDIYRNTAIIDYKLSMKIGYDNKIVMLDENMEAVMIKENQQWKILVIGQRNIVENALIKINLDSINKTNRSFTNSINNFNDSKNKKEMRDDKSSCGDGICELGENCQKDCKQLEFQQKCGDGICEKGENCRYDCNNLTHINLKENQKSSCKYEKAVSNFTEIDIKNLKLPKWVMEKFIYGTGIELKVGNETYFFKVDKGKVKKESTLNNKDVEYIISVSACTLSSLISGDLSFNEAYNNGLIKIKGNTFKGSIKTFFANLALRVMNIFHPSPKSVYQEGEAVTIQNPQKYSFTGNIAGVNSLYLGNTNSIAVYNTLQIPFRGKAYVYIKTFDDGKHRDGSRNVKFIFNQNSNSKELVYHHKSKNTGWKWLYLGEVNLNKGRVNVNVVKLAQTNAAFVMDKFVITNRMMKEEQMS